MRLTWILLPVVAVGIIATGLLLTSNLTRAVQAPTLAIDMVTADNTYVDTTNTMTVGFNPATDFCLATATANTATHLHTAHVIVQNVEDLVGWQVRLQYTGDRFRPNTVNFVPFPDGTTGQNISFVNLPIDSTSLVHRDLVNATNIPPGAPGPQVASVGSTYTGAQSQPISADTPAKTTPDDASYTAPSGGVVASITLQVVGDQSGQYLEIDMATKPPPPILEEGSGVSVFDGTGLVVMDLPETSLGGANHAEGGVCQAATATPSPTPTAATTATPTGPGGPTATRTPTPRAGAGTPTRTAAPAAAQLPDTGNAGAGDSSTLAYILLFTAVAVPVSGVTYAAVRLRRR